MLAVRAHMMLPVGSTFPSAWQPVSSSWAQRPAVPLSTIQHTQRKSGPGPHPVVMMDMLAADSSQPQFPLHEGDLWGPSLPAIRGSFRCKHHHHHHGEGQARKSIFPPCSPNSPTQSSSPPSAPPQVTFTLDVRCEAISPVFRIAGWECKRNV